MTSSPEKVHSKTEKWKSHAQSLLKSEAHESIFHVGASECKIVSERLPLLGGVAVSTQGRRKIMEDVASTFFFEVEIKGVLTPVHVAVLFDGHGAALMDYDELDQLDCALYCKEHLPKILEMILRKFLDSGAEIDVEIFNALKISLVTLDVEYQRYQKNLMEKKFTELKKNYYGTTAVITMFIQDKVWVANTGDSRAFFSTSDTCKLLTYDAKANDPLTTQSVRKRLGEIFKNRVNGILAVTRALGNEYLRHQCDIKAITPRPKITVLDLKSLSDSSFLVLASDGVFDVVPTWDVHRTIQEMYSKDKNIEKIGVAVVKRAFNAGATDNMTLMLLPLKDVLKK